VKVLFSLKVVDILLVEASTALVGLT